MKNGIAARTELMIPKRPTTEIAVGFNLQVRQQVGKANDIAAIEEGLRRLSAWNAYVKNRQQRDELQASARWCEMRIGALLGKGEAHRPKKTSLAREVNGTITKNDRHHFRQLYEYQAIVSPLILDGTVSRAKLLSAIKETTRKPSKKTVETFGDTLYDAAVIDPPWEMKKIDRDCRANQAVEYRTMSEAQLAELQLPLKANCHVWLWTTHKFLPMAFRLLDVWDLTYSCTFVWHKPGGFQPVGSPQYNCEFALYARKGAPKFVTTKAFKLCFNAARGKHSEKPSEFYDLVRRVTKGKRIDIFNRREIDGFTGWGDEAP